MTESGGYVEVETGIPYETVRELRKKGTKSASMSAATAVTSHQIEMHDGQRVYVARANHAKTARQRDISLIVLSRITHGSAPPG